MHDIRRFFNRVILQVRLGFTPEASGRSIGNSEIVNREHYCPISISTFEEKINTRRFAELLANSDFYANPNSGFVSKSSVSGVKLDFPRRIAL